MSKPENSAKKKNHLKISFIIRQAILKQLKPLQFDGCLADYDDVAVAKLADSLTNAIIFEDKLNIVLKRRKPC